MANYKTLENICDDDAKTISVDDSSIVIIPGQPVTIPVNASKQGYRFVVKHWINKDIRFNSIIYAGGEKQREQFIDCAIEYLEEINDHYRAGFLKLQKKDFEGALTDSEKILSNEPNNYDALKLKAVAKASLGHEDAEKYYRKAAEHAPNEEAKVLWKYTDTEAGDYFRQKEAAKKVAKVVTTPITPEQMAKINEENIKKTAERINKIFSLDNVIQDTYERKISIHMDGTFSIQDDATSRTFAYITKCASENKLNLLSYVVKDSPKQAKISSDFMTFALNEFKNKKDFVNLGNVYLRIGSFEDALDCFEVLKEFEPDNYKLYAGSAVAKYKLGNRKEAYIDMNIAQELNPRDSEWLINFWVTQERIRKENKSKESLPSKVKNKIHNCFCWVIDKILLQDIEHEKEHEAARMKIRQEYRDKGAQTESKFSGGSTYEKKLEQNRKFTAI